MKKKEIEEMLGKFADSLGENYDISKDPGHWALLEDLSSLMKEAIMYEFHDFKNEKYGGPKMTLHNKLLEIAENVKEGKYDN